MVMIVCPCVIFSCYAALEIACAITITTIMEVKIS